MWGLEASGAIETEVPLHSPRADAFSPPEVEWMTDRECVELLQWAAPRLGLRFRGFSRVRGQVCKRLTRRLRELELPDATAYRRRLEEDHSEWVRLDALCRVTISRFYRDKGVWDALGSELLPPLAQAATARGEPLRCWSAGCASGEEPYTLALVLRFAVTPRVPSGTLTWSILATDADPALIERTRRGCYWPATLRELPPEWEQRAFEERGGELCLWPEYRVGIELEVADVRDPPPAGPWDLLLCRNVVFTYLDREVQQKLLPELLARVRHGGLLVIGAHESLPAEAEARFHLSRVGTLPIFRYVPPHVLAKDRVEP